MSDLITIRTAAEQRILDGYADLSAERCRELAIKLGTPTEAGQ